MLQFRHANRHQTIKKDPQHREADGSSSVCSSSDSSSSGRFHGSLQGRLAAGTSESESDMARDLTKWKCSMVLEYMRYICIVGPAIYVRYTACYTAIYQYIEIKLVYCRKRAYIGPCRAVQYIEIYISIYIYRYLSGTSLMCLHGTATLTHIAPFTAPFNTGQRS